MSFSARDQLLVSDWSKKIQTLDLIRPGQTVGITTLAGEGQTVGTVEFADLVGVVLSLRAGLTFFPYSAIEALTVLDGGN